MAPQPPRRRASKAETAAARANWDEAIVQMSGSWPLVVTPRPRAEGALQTMGHPIVGARGKMDALTLAALIQRARGVVGDDAGALALADLLERPAVSAADLSDVPARALYRFGL